MLSLLRATAALLFVTACGLATAQITLDGDFDHGSLDEANSAVVGDLVQLAGRDNYNPGQWKWLYFSADGVSGTTPTFQIDDNFVTGGGNLDDHEMVYSYDQDNWFFFDNNGRNAGADTFTFSNNSAFTSDSVYVAYGLPYSIERATSHTSTVSASPWVSPTATGGSDLVVGQSPGGIDDLGRTIPQQDLYGYRITDPGATGLKAKIVLAGGVHSNETLGNHTLEAMIDYLLGDTLDAALLRRRAEFYVYPMVNPDGRLAGYNRGTVEDINRDPNRSWDPPNYDGQTEIQAIAEAMIADTGGDVDFFIDFHSTVQKGGDHFGYIDIDRNFHLNPFWQRLLELEPAVTTSDAALINDTSAKFGLFELDAGFTMTFETRFLAGENEDRFEVLGENFGQAFADILATPFGDLDFNGSIGPEDWLILSENAQTSTPSLSVIEAYAVGDLNLDGANDVLDFVLFKDAYQQANGLGSFARLVAGVPEPGTFGLVALGLISLATQRRRRQLTKSHNMPSRRTQSVAIAAVTVLLLAAITPHAEATIFEDFLFDDTAGTLITGVANTANPGNLFSEDTDSIEVATNGLGQLDGSLKANTGFGTNFLDIEPALTTGTIFGVMEMTWDFQSTLDTAENEEIRLSLINNNPTGTEITGEFRIVRNDSDQLIINGQAGGTGSSDLPDTLLNGGSLSQTDKFIAVVAADLDNSTYEILYSNDAGASFLSAGTGNSAPGRVVESMRMTLNNDLSGDNVLIDRFYLADALPIVIDPDSLTLYVHPKSGHVAIVNETGTVFDIDYYRIQSGDDSLVESRWNSLQAQATDAVDGADGGSTVGDGIGETWTEAGGSDAGVLSESFLLGSSQVAENEALPLGGAFDLTGDDQQLTFEFRDSATGNIFEGDVLVGDLLAGDFNLDGKVDAADYTVYRDNASGQFTAADYTVWANNYGAQLAASSSAAVPEPASLGLLAAALALLPRFRRVS